MKVYRRENKYSPTRNSATRKRQNLIVYLTNVAFESLYQVKLILSDFNQFVLLDY